MTIQSVTSRDVDIVEQAHRQATRAPLTEVAGLLQEVLSRRVTAFIAGVDSGKTVARWASGEVSDIRDPDVEKRLRCAYAITSMLLAFESPRTVKAWFIGMNPDLDDISAAEAIRDDLLRDAIDAAVEFIVNG